MMSVNLQAIIFTVLAGLFAVLINSIVRYLSADIHPWQILFFRNLFALLFFLPWLIAHKKSAWKTRCPGIHSFRALFQTLGMGALFFSLSVSPFSQVQALLLIMPILITAGGILFLSETATWPRVLALFWGVIGSLVIIRPGFSEVNIGTWFAIAAAICLSSVQLMTKQATEVDSTPTIVFYLTLGVIPMSFIPALLVWQSPTFYQLSILFLIACLGNLSLLSITKAYSLADVGIIEPMSFIRFIWAGLIGSVFFLEEQDYFEWFGAAIIILGTTYMARHQHSNVKP